MLAGYFDDSGHESEPGPVGRFYSTAGYLSDERYWNELATAWRQLLMLHELREIHMKTFYAEAKGKGWTQEKAHAVLGDFVDVIRQSKMMGFGVGIDVKFWRGLSRERRKRFGTAAEFAMQRILRMVIDKLEAEAYHDEVGVIFDQDREMAKARLSRYFAVQDFDAMFKSKVVGISFVGAHNCPPLQAADMLAWQTRRNLILRENGLEATPILKQMLVPVPGEELHYHHEFWDERSLPALEKAEAQMEALKEVKPAS